MKELREIARAWEAQRAQGGTAALATVVRVDGSSYRRPGARMLILPDGETLGSVSGGCLEADVVERARRVVETSQAEVVTYDTTDEADLVFGVGLGCQGIVRILIECLSPDVDAALSLPLDLLEREKPGVLATVSDVEGAEGMVIGDRWLLSPGDRWQGPANLAAEAKRVLEARTSVFRSFTIGTGRVEVFFEYIQPPLSLVLVGAGPDAQPLVRLGTEMGWRVTVVDSRPAFVNAARFPGAEAVRLSPRDGLPAGLRLDARTTAVVMTHNYGHDRAALAALLPSPVFYLGILGPKRRTETLLAELREDGLTVTEGMLSRLHSPIGLDIGGETPEQIALAIVAEIQAVTAGRHGGFLRDRGGAIYDRAEGETGESVMGERPRCALSG